MRQAAGVVAYLFDGILLLNAFDWLALNDLLVVSKCFKHVAYQEVGGKPGCYMLLPHVWQR